MRKSYLSIALSAVLLLGCNSEDSSTGSVIDPDNTTTNTRGHFAGSEACAECHQEQYQNWKGTRHASFVRKLYTEEQHERELDALWGTEFQPKEVVFKDKYRVRLSMKGDKYWLSFVDAKDSSKTVDYQIDAVGYRTQLIFMSYNEEANTLMWFPFVWRTDDNRWFSYSEYFWFNPDGTLRDAAGIDHATTLASYENRCADCHLTGFEIKSWKDKNGFRVVGESNIWEAEMQTGCEKCHGPAYVHTVTQNPDDVIDPKDLTGTNKQSECDQCHTAGLPEGGNHTNELPYIFNKEDPYAAGQHFNVGDNFIDFYTPTQRRIYAGTEHLKQSKTYGVQLKQGPHAQLTCSDCHEPHSMATRIEGDGMCLSCHTQPHESDLPMENVKCVDCHMIFNGHSLDRSKRYELRTHSFKMLTPSISLQAFDYMAPFVKDDAPADHEMTKKWQDILKFNGACYDDWVYPANLKECAEFDVIPNACSSCHSDEFPAPGVFTDEERQKLQQGEARYQRFVDAQR